MIEALYPRLGKRYEVLEFIGKGGMGAVYLVHDRLENRRVALKCVPLSTAKKAMPEFDGGTSMGHRSTRVNVVGLPTTANDPAEVRPNEDVVIAVNHGRINSDHLQSLRSSLANEFRTLASLRHPNIVSVLDYGFSSDRQPYFTMELLAQGQSLDDVSRDSSLVHKVSLLLQILQALSYLHRRDVLHRDLKPTNILCITTATGIRVKLLDFGLALLHGSQRLELSEISGTMGYIAPEVLRGRPITPQADLYSFGVVACELLTGSSIWKAESATALFTEALEHAPAVDLSRLPPALAEALRRLLAQEPGDRFATADQTARVLAESVGILTIPESSELRDCVIGSAELVGRDAELAVLTSALRDSLGGHGQLVLLAGKSGIGKSRLLDELRTLALVEGAQVLQVQAKSAGSTDLGLFTEALRTLCLDDPPMLLTASVLKSIISDLPDLINREILDAPEIDAQAARHRLMSAVESILLAIKRPTIFLLEDLHWAGPDSIELLCRIAGQLAGRPLMLVGSYRSDERPQLGSELSGGKVVPILPLLRQDIARLSASILGEGRTTDRLLDWLTVQSEGNSFFITEVMRALAEEAGMLDAIGETALPKDILTGGMDAVLRRRLGQVPALAQPLLRVAAIAGRQLDLAVLRVFDSGLEDWLQACAAAGVLEVHDPSWRFSHDKLRERLLADLSFSEKTTLHRLLAGAIEQSYGETGDHAATLAFHYEQGQEFVKAATYATMAGALAVRRGALAEAVSLLQTAVVLQERLNFPYSRRAHTHKLLAEAHYGLSQYEMGLASVAQALAFLNRPLPAGKQAAMWAVLKQVGTQLWHRVHAPATLPVASAEMAEHLLELTWLHTFNLEMNAYLGRMDGVAYSSLYLANLGDEYRNSGLLIPFQSNLSLLLALSPVPLPDGGRLEETMALLPKLREAKTQLLVMQRVGNVYHYRGEQRKAYSILKQSLALAEQIGDFTTQRMILAYLNRTAKYLGEYAAALQFAQRLHALARSMADELWLITSEVLLIVTHLNLDELAEAKVYLKSAERIATKALGESIYFIANHQALVAARLGRFREAEQQLLFFLSGAEKNPINVFGGIEHYLAPIEAAMILREHATNPSEQRSTEALCRRAIRLVHRFALLSPHGWAPLWMLHGRAAWHRGQMRRAAWLFSAARRMAERYQMLPLAALATCWLGRSQPAGPDWNETQKGLDKLRQYEAKWDVATIEQWFKPPR